MFKEERKASQFEWQHLGNIEDGRPNLGHTASVLMYRLMHFTIRDAAIKHVGVDTTNQIFYDAGQTAGKMFVKELIPIKADWSTNLAAMGNAMIEKGVGVLRVEESNFDTLEFTLTLSEDLECSGVSIVDETICIYDEGFLSGIFEVLGGQAFKVQEIDCWCMGDRVCRFKIFPHPDPS